MKKVLLPLALLLVGLGGGLAFGVYYHNEITVWLRPATSPVPTAPPPPGTASTLHLKTLTEPLPLIYSETLEEPQLQEYLKSGAVVLPLGTGFGEPGNVVVTAHSSGSTAFGPYRFAFAKLSELNAGEEFSVATPAHRYTYRVYAKEIVWPHQVDRLPHDDRSTVTLVTCWPLWTNFKRLLVHSELVSVDN